MVDLQVTEPGEQDQVKEEVILTTPGDHELPQFPPWSGAGTGHDHYLE